MLSSIIMLLFPLSPIFVLCLLIEFEKEFFNNFNYFMIPINILLIRHELLIGYTDLYVLIKYISFLVPNIHIKTHKWAFYCPCFVLRKPNLWNDISLSIHRKNLVSILSININRFFIEPIFTVFINDFPLF